MLKLHNYILRQYLKIKRFCNSIECKFYDFSSSLFIAILVATMLDNPTDKFSKYIQNTDPCNGCLIIWLDPCCVSFKCPALTNYSVGVDGYGASGYCHGVIYPVLGPGGFTTVCSPKPGLVVLYLWQSDRCIPQYYDVFGTQCDDPMPCN